MKLRNIVTLFLSLLLITSLGSTAFAVPVPVPPSAAPSEKVDMAAVNAEGDAMFEKFVAATKVLEEDSKYSRGLAVLGASTNNAQWIADSGYFTEDEWKVLSDYDRMCYYRLYFMFCYFDEAGDYNRFFGDEESFTFYFLNDISVLNQTQEFPDGVYKAFEDILNWQYQYFLKYGDFYNFKTGVSYMKYKASSYTNNNGAAIAPSDNPATDTKDNLSLKSELSDKLLHNIIYIVILFGLVIVILFLARKRRKENREDTMNEDR